jgi:hypothetical protein
MHEVHEGLRVKTGGLGHKVPKLGLASVGREELVGGDGSTTFISGVDVGVIPVDLTTIGKTTARTMKPSARALVPGYHRVPCIGSSPLGSSYDWQLGSSKLALDGQGFKIWIDLRPSKSL